MIIAISLLTPMLFSIVAANIWCHKERSQLTQEQLEEENDDLRYEARIW